MSRSRSSVLAMTGIVIVVVVLAALAIAALMQRSREREQLTVLLTQSSFTLSESLNNPAIFTHQGVEDLASLHQSASLLNELQTRIAGMRVYLTKSSRDSGMQYLDYLNRIAKKLNETSDAQGQVDQAMAEYQASMNSLHAMRGLQRATIVQTLERNRMAVRSSTELAYQEASLLQRLLEQYPYMVSIVSSNLNKSVLIDPASWSGFKTALQKEIVRRNEIRREFNPAAR